MTKNQSGKLKLTPMSEVKDRFLGKEGTIKRDNYELELKLDLIGEMIKQARKERNLTQSELGDLIGVQKAQISKLENGTSNVTISTILKVFEALKAKVNFRVELLNQKVEILQ